MILTNNYNLDFTKIDQIIKSIIPDKYEDTIQETWVKVLENNTDTKEDVLQIALNITKKHKRQHYDILFNEYSLDTPIKSKIDPYDNTKTLLDILPSPDENEYTTTKIYRKSNNDIESEGICKSCNKHSILLNGLCNKCWDKCLDNHAIYYANHKISGICLKCNQPTLPHHVYCAYHLINKRAKYRLLSKAKYHYRKDNHLCTQCGKPINFISARLLCFECRNKKAKLRHRNCKLTLDEKLRLYMLTNGKSIIGN